MSYLVLQSRRGFLITRSKIIKILAVSSTVVLVFVGLNYFRSYLQPRANELDEGLTFYQSAPFDFLLPNQSPSVNQKVKTVSIDVAAGEFEPLTFNAYSSTTLTDVTLELSDLKSGDSVIPKDNIDPRIVKVWPQAGYDVLRQLEPDKAAQVPELLVYNDQESLPPLATTKSQLLTTIPGQTSKQFWLTVHVPPGKQAGEYLGTATLKSNGQSDNTLQLRVNVLPFELRPTAQKNYAMYSMLYNSTVTKDTFRLHVKDMVAHGYTGIRLPMSPVSSADATEIFDLLKSEGMTSAIVAFKNSALDNLKAPLIAELVEKGRTAGLEIYFYGVDEPNEPKATTPDKLIHLPRQLKYTHLIHSQGGKVATALLPITDAWLRDPSHFIYDAVIPGSDPAQTFRQAGIADGATDMPIYHSQNLQYTNRGVDKPLWDYIESVRNDRAKKDSRPELFYWQAWFDKPLQNRQRAGYFNSNSLNGVLTVDYMSSSYSDFPPTARDLGSPYDDFDTVQRQGKSVYRDIAMVYPPINNPIPTLGWEAIREGFDDLRYVETLRDRISQLKGGHAELAQTLQSRLEVELAKYKDVVRSADPTQSAANSLNGGNFQSSRAVLANAIMEADQALLPVPPPASFLSPNPTSSPLDLIAQSPVLPPNETISPAGDSSQSAEPTANDDPNSTLEPNVDLSPTDDESDTTADVSSPDVRPQPDPSPALTTTPEVGAASSASSRPKEKKTQTLSQSTPASTVAVVVSPSPSPVRPLILISRKTFAAQRPVISQRAWYSNVLVGACFTLKAIRINLSACD